MREKLIELLEDAWQADTWEEIADHLIANGVTIPVRCRNCVHSQPLDRNCELATGYYMHCKLWHGEETRNVWHKYKKYYKDYSLVEHDDFCSYGERRTDNE